MATKAKTVYGSVSALPVKSFFVTMLTRDIPLADAILDLLDNCVDGILRTEGKAIQSYAGYQATITFDKSHFMIHDNCGGIPWSLHDYAFRLGAPANQPKKKLPMVGVYGIGMKRAIFKLGEQCLITTRNAKDNYEVEITPAWVKSEEDWDLPVRAATETMKEPGTTIVIGQLYEGIKKTFGEGGKAAFHAELSRRVSELYAFIIAKGFTVTINGEDVEPRPTKLAFQAVEGKRRASGAILPFIYRTKVDDVHVFLAIGLTRAIPTAEEVDDEDSGSQTRYKSLAAGWTVVCNDRAVVYCDRTELTGWGEDDIPRYHTQFIAISGIVEFRSDKAEKLPTTTTKRGIDAASPLFLQVKNKMREGLKLFTTFTYWWKGKEPEVRTIIDKADVYTFSELKKRADELNMTKVTRLPGGQQFKPSLPRPKAQQSNITRISFERPLSEVRLVGDYVLDDANAKPSKIGDECFKTILKEAKKLKHPPYHLRVNKAVDRFMLVEVLSIFAKEFDELRNYRYYGLGGPFLEDFRLIGDHFTDLPLVSLESNEQTYRRQKFHQCAKNVTLRRETVQAFLNNASWAKPAVYWLDYTDLVPARIQEFQSLLDRVHEDSVVKITLRAALDDLSEACIRSLADINPELREQWRDRQLASFKSTFEAVLPPGVDSTRLRPGNFPALLQDMLRIASQQRLQGSGRHFQILHSCFYSDHTPMYSLTGVVCGEDDTRRFQQRFARWPHKNLRWAAPQRIDMPVLSTKERMALEALLPARATTGKALRRALGYDIDEGGSATTRKLRHYAAFYRYYPHFAKVAVV